MTKIKRIISVALATVVVLSLNFTTVVFAESEKSIDIDGSDGCYATITNVISEDTVCIVDDRYVESIIVMDFVTVSAPSTITFVNGSSDLWNSVLAFEDIYYLPNGEITDGELSFGESYEDVEFDVKEYIYHDDEGISPLATGNYANLTKPGLYYVVASPEALESTKFVIKVESDSSIEQPSVVDDSSLTAIPAASKVLVNGNDISFDAYNINGYNYFKLRDLAMAIKGSEKQFEISWDSENNAINLITNNTYTEVGGELGVVSEKLPTEAIETTSSIFINGKEMNLTAFNINGNNYFMLRDIGELINFGITWDGETSTIGIDTSIDYTL